jgi:hypothetical protein
VREIDYLAIREFDLTESPPAPKRITKPRYTHRERTLRKRFIELWIRRTGADRPPHHLFVKDDRLFQSGQRYAIGFPALDEEGNSRTGWATVTPGVSDVSKLFQRKGQLCSYDDRASPVSTEVVWEELRSNLWDKRAFAVSSMDHLLAPWVQFEFDDEDVESIDESNASEFLDFEYIEHLRECGIRPILHGSGKRSIHVSFFFRRAVRRENLALLAELASRVFHGVELCSNSLTRCMRMPLSRHQVTGCESALWRCWEGRVDSMSVGEMVSLMESEEIFSSWEACRDEMRSLRIAVPRIPRQLVQRKSRKGGRKRILYKHEGAGFSSESRHKSCDDRHLLPKWGSAERARIVASRDHRQIPQAIPEGLYNTAFLGNFSLLGRIFNSAGRNWSEFVHRCELISRADVDETKGTDRVTRLHLTLQKFDPQRVPFPRNRASEMDGGLPEPDEEQAKALRALVEKVIYHWRKAHPRGTAPSRRTLRGVIWALIVRTPDGQIGWQSVRALARSLRVDRHTVGRHIRLVCRGDWPEPPLPLFEMRRRHSAPGRGNRGRQGKCRVYQAQSPECPMDEIEFHRCLWPNDNSDNPMCELHTC